jgi:hypothetical protein
MELQVQCIYFRLARVKQRISPTNKGWSTFPEEETKSESQTVTFFFSLTEA